MKKKLLISMLFMAAAIGLMSSVEVTSNGDLRIGGVKTAIFYDGVGRFAQASGFSMNKNVTTKGLVFEFGANESAGFYADGEYAVIWSPGDYDRLLRIYDEDAMNSTSTTYEKAYIDGDGDYFKNSDGRRKNSVQNLNSSLTKVKKLRGVDYYYNQTSEELRKNGGYNKKHVGFIAQELETIIPEVVDTDEYGNKFVNYDGVIPYLVEALKEQQNQIDELKKELQQLKK